MSAAEAAVIGRDLILRRQALYTKDFRVAAFLASDGTAGNDGFMDFTDCVALLPEDRYQRVRNTPDDLIDDPVSSGFGEHYLVAEVCRVFDRALLDDQEGEGFLHYLIVGEDGTTGHDEINSMSDEDAKEALPRLYAKFGRLLRPSRPRHQIPNSNTVTLDDLIP
jgi:hypothetical protein